MKSNPKVAFLPFSEETVEGINCSSTVTLTKQVVTIKEKPEFRL
jgi:hypothetical protein